MSTWYAPGRYNTGVSTRYTAVVQDETGTAIPASSLTTLTATLFVMAGNVPGGIVNSLDHVNILNTGRGAVDANGNLTVTLLPADMACPSGQTEQHGLLIEWTYNSGAKAGSRLILFDIDPTPHQ